MRPQTRPVRLAVEGVLDCLRSGFNLFHLDSHLAAIVSAGGAYRVVNVELSTIGAFRQCGRYRLVVGSSFEGASLRLSSFRMCHCCLCIMCLLFFLFLFLCPCHHQPLQDAGHPAVALPFRVNVLQGHLQGNELEEDTG